MNTTTRNRLIIGGALVVGGIYIAIQMFFATTPPRHADHDHAMAKLDAGGFLRIEATDGSRRNLVGKPNKVLVLHWFSPTSTGIEEASAARFADSVRSDAGIDVLFVAQAPSWDGVEDFAAKHEISPDQLYLDKDGKIAELIGVRRNPETLVYDPAGLLAYQAKGAMDWRLPSVNGIVNRAKAGVDEIH